jgi:hypothetical protein
MKTNLYLTALQIGAFTETSKISFQKLEIISDELIVQPVTRKELLCAETCQKLQLLSSCTDTANTLYVTYPKQALLNKHWGFYLNYRSLKGSERGGSFGNLLQ